MRCSCQLVGIVRNGRSSSSLIGPVLFRILLIDDKDRPASPWMTDQPVNSINILPLVHLVEVVAVLVDALGDPVGLELRLAARASGGPPRVESNYSGIDMNSSQSPLFSSLRPIVANGPHRNGVDERD